MLFEDHIQVLAQDFWSYEQLLQSHECTLTSASLLPCDVQRTQLWAQPDNVGQFLLTFQAHQNTTTYKLQKMVKNLHENTTAAV